MVEKLKPVKLLIESLSLDSKTQQRIATSDDAVAEYAAVIRSGLTLPPITVYFDRERYYIADGWHRVLAYLEAGEKYIMAYVKDGTLRDAIFAATGANVDHGVRRTNADKRQAVCTLLKDAEWCKISSRMIAEHCGVGHDMVERYRHQLAETPVDNGRTGKDGKERPATQKRVVKTPQAKPGQEVEADEEAEETDFDPANLPSGATDIDALASDYKSAINALVGVKKTMKRLAEDERFGGWLVDKITRIGTDLDQIRGAIRQMEPTAKCDRCAGEGCQICRSTGFWTRSMVEAKRK